MRRLKPSAHPSSSRWAMMIVIMSRLRLIPVVLLAMGIAGVACGGSDEPVAPEASLTSTVPSTPATTAAQPPPASTTAASVTTGAPDVQTSEQPVETTTPTVATTASVPETVATSAATSPPATEAPVASGPPVPALTLQLDDGTTFVTTEAARPTYYLFWAEW